MSRYIDADALIEELERCSCDTWSKGVDRTWWAQAVKVKDNIKRCIDRQPTADVVEVVRCKDCEYCHEYTKWNGKDFLACKRLAEFCDGQVVEVVATDFCSYGERKEENGT